MFYAILCLDHPGSGELRETVRPSHLKFLQQHPSTLRVGGPLENEDGDPIGAIFVINVESRAAAMAFMEQEPFHKAGLYESMIVRRWRQVAPQVEARPLANSANEAILQLKEEGQQKG